MYIFFPRSLETYKAKKGGLRPLGRRVERPILMHQAAAVSLGLHRKKKGWPTKNKTMLLAAFLHTTAAILGLLDSQDDNSQEE